MTRRPALFMAALADSTVLPVTPGTSTVLPASSSSPSSYSGSTPRYLSVSSRIMRA